MPKFATYPTCFDEVKAVTIGDLKRLGYLRTNAIVRGLYRWTRGGKPCGWIEVTVNLPERFLQLGYRVNGGDLISYRVRLESLPNTMAVVNGILLVHQRASDAEPSTE